MLFRDDQYDKGPRSEKNLSQAATHAPTVTHPIHGKARSVVRAGPEHAASRMSTKERKKRREKKKKWREKKGEERKNKRGGREKNEEEKKTGEKKKKERKKKESVWGVSALYCCAV